MAGPLSNLPLGLNDLVGLRGQLSYPNDLGQVIAPGIDIRDMIVTSYAEVLTDSVTVNAAGAFAFANTLTIPQNENWVLEAFSISCGTILVGENLRARPAIFVQGGSGGTFARYGEEGASSLTDAVGVGQISASLNGPLVLSPNTTFNVQVNKITTAGTITVNGRIRFMRMRR